MKFFVERTTITLLGDESDYVNSAIVFEHYPFFSFWRILLPRGIHRPRTGKAACSSRADAEGDGWMMGEQYEDSTQLLYLRARHYSPADGRFTSRDTWSGDYNRPLSLNRWIYVEGNPINRVDPSGLAACSDSLDPECIRLARNLHAKAASLKRFVKNGTVLPVEALAQLVDYANDKFADHRGMMWGLTNVLLGIDPNSVSVWKLGLAGTDNYKGINPSSNPYYIEQDWLPYKHNPQENPRHSEQGDWRDEYWDKTPNQAFHFWYFAAVEYYDNWLMATLANRFHDPYLLECFLGDDLNKLKGINVGGNDITQFFDETSREDYLLGDKGIEFGRMMWRYGWTSVVNPGGWIRVNLSSSYK